MYAAPMCSLFGLLLLVSSGCSPEGTQRASLPTPARPSILLVTLDTTRADRMGFENKGVVETPTLDGLATRGMRFSQALTTAPMTLPAHASMLTGLYPSDHGIHENSRVVSTSHTLLAERLRESGYATAAFVSGYPLTRRFGLARGFDHYDDLFDDERAERVAGATTDRALAYMGRSPDGQLFVWVHYFDPHEPYAPPEPFRSGYAEDPYAGEIAYVDQQLGRLIAGFERHCGGSEWRILVVGDHGEGLGEHGEVLHGNLLYQGVMRVPMIMAGSGIGPAVVDQPVSIRRIFHTILAWAGLESTFDLVSATPEVVMAEALKPFLQYGWQPQVMAVRNNLKVIRSGDTEIYDIEKDASESIDLSGQVGLGQDLATALESYAVAPAATAGGSYESLDQESRERLASLGYVGSTSPAPVREGAPNPRDMVYLFRDLDRGSALFVNQEYGAAIEVFEKVLSEDDENLMVVMRLAVAHSALGHEDRALGLFAEAERIHPESIDRKHYLAMHYFRFGEHDHAADLFESVLEMEPNRLPALKALARIRADQGRFENAARLQERIIRLADSTAAEWKRLGELEMATGDTAGAIRAFEEASTLEGEEFDRFLELGVCYLADRRLVEAAATLDKVDSDHPGHSMALFKRAQASVLLGEADWRQRVQLAYERADPAIRSLILDEPLFQGMDVR